MKLRRMKKIGTSILYSSILLSQQSAFADVMDPSSSTMSQHFSKKVIADYHLFADTDNPKIVYYIPKSGGVKLDAPYSSNPIPRFQVNSFVPVNGFWAGQELVNLGGSFSTDNLGSLRQLQHEAKEKNLQISPAPVESSTTTFMSAAKIIEGSRLAVNCLFEDLKITRSNGTEAQVKIPHCNAKSEPGAPEYDLDTNVMYKFTASRALGGATADQMIPFQAITLPGWSSQISSLMNSGGQWDNILTGSVDWKIKAQSQTYRARAIIRWSQVFEQASSFFAAHNNACYDVEVSAFFKRLATCDNPERCGVKMEYLDKSNPNNPRWTMIAPNNYDFIQQVNAFQNSVEKDLFNEVAAYSQSQLGEVSKKSSAMYTLRANYEKIAMEKNETREFTYNPGPVAKEARTVLNISCLKGGFGERVSWDMDFEGCKDLAGNQ